MYLLQYIECNVPLMKSKKGAKICCGCGKDFAEKEKIEKEQNEPKKEKKKVPTTQKKQEDKQGGNAKLKIEGLILKSLDFLEGKM